MESYCLGSTTTEEAALVKKYMEQYEEVREEVASIRLGIEQYASLHAVNPPDDVRSSVLSAIDALSEKDSSEEHPLKHKEISKGASVAEWRKIAEGVEPPDDYDIHLHQIYADQHKLLFIGWVKEMVPAEVHTDLYESFFLLEGSCTCKVGDEYIDLKEGDFFPIPLHVEHSLKVTSDHPVRAILQRKFVA